MVNNEHIHAEKHELDPSGDNEKVYANTGETQLSIAHPSGETVISNNNGNDIKDQV